jgi:hypothetical protein
MTEIAGYCTSCGAGLQPGQNYCGGCGTAVSPVGAVSAHDPASGSRVTGSGSASTSTATDFSSSAGAGFGTQNGAEPGPDDDAPYQREAMIGAILLTIFLPFIALIAALVLRAEERRPARREQLKNWALASGGWLATGWVIAIIAFASVVSAVGPSGCKGGIDLTVPPSYESSDGKHWVGTFACMNGGTTTKPVPASQVPGGG